MSGESEEKKFPPTPAKLKRARKEGRVPHSRDLVLLSMVPTLLWLYFAWPSHERKLLDIMQLPFRQDYAISADELIRRIAPGVLWMAFDFIVPFLFIAVVVAIVVAIADTGGVVFSGKPVAPNFSRLNPAEGFKRIFSARSATESGFGLVKMLIFALMTVSILALAQRAMVRAQVCGLACVPDAFSATVDPIIAAFIAILVIMAVIDFNLSRQLFRHEMRMSHTELKHENKDVYGSPEVKRRQRDESRSALQGPARLGVGSSTLLIQGRDIVVGLRYMPSELPAPVVVAKASGLASEEVLNQARALGIPIAVNLLLSRTLFDQGFLGQVIPASTFTSAAAEIIKSGG